MVREVWQYEFAVRQLYEPAPIDIPWCIEPELMIGDLYARTGLPDRKGSLTTIVDLFTRQAAKQLVILGKPGSGKSTLALYLVAELLKTRQAGSPVPVLVSLSGWRPRDVDFVGWMAERIDEDQRTRAVRVTPDVVKALLRSGQIMPVLDGLDEMPEDHRKSALRALTGFIGNGPKPLILTSRTDVYRGLDNKPPLALAITLQPISIDTALGFVTGGDADRLWDSVRDRIVTDEHGPIATALTVPLMAWLARVAYASREPPRPEELLAAPTPEAVENRLLSNLVPALYEQDQDRLLRGAKGVTRRYAHDVFQRISCHLTNEESLNLKWWELHTLVPAPMQILLVTLAVYASASIGVTTSWLVPALHSVAPLISVAAAAFGPYLGVGVALAGPPDRPTRLAFALSPSASGRSALGPYPFRFVIGSLVGGLSALLGLVLTGNISFAVGLFLLGAVIGGVFTLFGTPDVTQAATPRNLYANDRIAFYAFALVGVLATGAGGAIVGFLTGGFSATVCGAWAGGVCGALVGTVLGRRWPRIAALGIGVSTGLALGLLVGRVAGGGVHGSLTTAATGASLGLCLGVVTGIASTSTGWLVLTEIYLALSVAVPRKRLLTFLDGAHDCGLLRCEGAVYQFRHQKLQEWFANGPSS